jgi:N-acetylmuramoyl-L-alanine amidase
VLFPAKNIDSKTIKTICLDAGHGGKDPGRMNGKMQEKNFTLLLSKEVERLLEKEGFKVVQTRARDEYVELTDRTRIANTHKADLFVSLHYNAFVNRNVEGVEVFCVTPVGTASSDSDDWKRPSSPVYAGNAHDEENILLAYQMQKSLVKNLDIEDRGVKRAQFVVLLDGKMPSILIEGGFLTNPKEARRIYDSAYRKKMAQAIVDGILSYQKIVEKPSASVTKK